jgi:hypothetical protein
MPTRVERAEFFLGALHRDVSVEVFGYVPSIMVATEAPVLDQFIDDPRADVSTQAEQPASLLRGQPQAGHLAELCEDAVKEVVSRRQIAPLDRRTPRRQGRLGTSDGCSVAGNV